MYKKISSKKIPVFILFIFFKDFMWSEIKYTLNGIIQYNYNSINLNEYKLRRNIHRLEKGLCSKNRRKIFGLAYIDETVDEFIKFYKEDSKSEKSKYYLGILKHFFNVVDKNNIIIKTAFNKLKEINNFAKIECKEEKKLLFLKKAESNSSQIFHNLLESRRSVRFYLQQKIEKSIIQEAINASNNSPSACNRLPYEFFIFNEKDKINKILKFADGFQGNPNHVPYLLVLVGDLSAYISQADRHLIYIDSSYGIMNFILSLRTKNIGSCILNYSENKEYDIQLSKLLKLEDHKRVINFMTFGYIDFSIPVPYSYKKYDNFSFNKDIN